MFWKALVAVLFIAGVFGKYELTATKKASLREALRKQCENVNEPDAVEKSTDDATTAIENFIACLTGIVDVDALKKEIEEAKPKGALDEVFKKYCAKTPEIKTCIHSVFDAIVPCLDGTSKSQINAAKNGTDQLIDFVCYKDGDRIALFISEKGPECFASKTEPIRECFQKVQGELTIDKAKELTMAERCGKFDDFSACVVVALEGCDTLTPGNMAESLFKYVRKSSPCNEALPKTN